MGSSSSGHHTFRARPTLPELDHEVFQILIPQGLIYPLPVKSLAKTPTRVDPPQSLETGLLLLGRPDPVPALARLTSTDPSRHSSLPRQQRSLDALQEYLVMQTRLRAPAERDSQVHEIRVLSQPLVGLPSAHAPAQHSVGMIHPQAFGDQPILCDDIVFKGHVGEGLVLGKVWHVGGAGGLAIAEQGGDDDEVFIWAKSLVCVNEPFIVGYLSRVPGWIDDGWRGVAAEGLVCDEGLGEDDARGQGKVA